MTGQQNRQSLLMYYVVDTPQQSPLLFSDEGSPSTSPINLVQYGANLNADTRYARGSTTREQVNNATTIEHSDYG